MSAPVRRRLWDGPGVVIVFDSLASSGIWRDVEEARPERRADFFAKMVVGGGGADVARGFGLAFDDEPRCEKSMKPRWWTTGAANPSSVPLKTWLGSVTEPLQCYR